MFLLGVFNWTLSIYIPSIICLVNLATQLLNLTISDLIGHKQKSNCILKAAIVQVISFNPRSIH